MERALNHEKESKLHSLRDRGHAVLFLLQRRRDPCWSRCRVGGGDRAGEQGESGGLAAATIQGGCGVV